MCEQGRSVNWPFFGLERNYGIMFEIILLSTSMCVVYIYEIRVIPIGIVATDKQDGLRDMVIMTVRLHFPVQLVTEPT